MPVQIINQDIIIPTIILIITITITNTESNSIKAITTRENTTTTGATVVTAQKENVKSTTVHALMRGIIGANHIVAIIR